MKFIMASILCLSLNAFADHHEEMSKKMDNMSFEDAKKMKLEMLDKKSKMIEEQRGCINSAKDKEGMKACWDKMKEKKKDMKKEMKKKKK